MSLFKAIAEYHPEQVSQSLAELAAPYLPPLWQSQYRTLGVDITSYPRPYAFKLRERECVYKVTPIKGQKPITYGHQFLNINQLVEKTSQHAPAWAIPLSTRRVSRANQEPLTIALMRNLLQNPKLPFHRETCIQVGDSNFSTPSYLSAFSDMSHLITIARSRGNRKYYCLAQETGRTGRGHVNWFGHKMKLNDPQTWLPAAEEVSFCIISGKDKRQTVKIQAWKNMVMRGKYKPVRLPMQNYPFTLVKVEVYHETRELVYEKPLWLIVMGRLRDQLSLPEIYAAFGERSGMEHFFRFAKQRLLLDGFQTCETEHEEHWWQIASLAYLQLWVAQEHASLLPRPGNDISR
jgi:hypothetical protein